MNKKNQPSILEASLVLTFIIASIALSVIVLKVTPNIAILFSIALVLLYVVIKRIPFDRVNEGIVNGIKPGIIPIFIFISRCLNLCMDSSWNYSNINGLRF